MIDQEIEVIKKIAERNNISYLEAILTIISNRV